MRKLNEFLNEAKKPGIDTKDWERMLDLYLANDRQGVKVAGQITDKNKAVARFIAGIKISGDVLKFSNNEIDYRVDYNAIGDKALKLGASIEEIQQLYNDTEVPQEVIDKKHSMSGLGLHTFLADFSKFILKLGYKIEYEKGEKGKVKSFNAITQGGKDAMSRNGRKWTMGYKSIIDLGNKKINFDFDIVTDEGGSASKYAYDQFGYGDIFTKSEFFNDVAKYLKEEENK